MRVLTKVKGETEDLVQPEEDNKMMTIQQIYKLFLKSNGVSTDSRSITSGCMFIALRGDNFNGNDFIKQALDSGASFAITDEDTFTGDERVIYVKDSLTTLQELARHHRRELNTPLFGLTGSNGKTTTKELITTVLSTKFNVISTSGNLNNHIGVPLTVLKIDKNTEIAIIEMGASAPGDIALLCSICMPDAGLITNVGKAHLLGFGSFEGVMKTKGELYDFLNNSGGTVLFNSSNEHLSRMVSQREGLRSVTYGMNERRAEVLRISSDPHLHLSIDDGKIVIKTNLIGDYNADNILAALAVGEFYGTDPLVSARAIENYIPTNNRSQLVNTKYNTLVVDAYNANPTSMRAALDNFFKLNLSPMGLIIGDMLELGEFSGNEHTAILRYVEESSAASVYFVGKEFMSAAEQGGFKAKNTLFFESSIKLREYLEFNTPKGMTFLIKGSRGTRLERVLDVL